MPKCEHRDWTENKAEEAVNTCHKGMSIWRAAEFYDILKSTICEAEWEDANGTKEGATYETLTIT